MRQEAGSRSSSFFFMCKVRSPPYRGDVEGLVSNKTPGRRRKGGGGKTITGGSCYRGHRGLTGRWKTKKWRPGLCFSSHFKNFK